MSDIPKVRVFLVDDHALVREALRFLISQQPDLVVCGEAEGAAEAATGIAASQPDVVIMDISLRDSTGLDLLKSVHGQNADTKIIILSMHDEKLYAERCIRAGAQGYVMKAESSKRFLYAIREVMAGRLCVSEQMAAILAEKYVGLKAPTGSPLQTLSDRELEVYNLLGKGLETRQIAQSLNVSIKTVQAYCGRIKQKLGLGSGAELLREAICWHETQGGSTSL
jgi:DNA-binding NarL/FixJ family response regulator